MKKFLKIFFSMIIVIVMLGIIFYMVDTARVHNEEEPIFTFNHKIVDGIDYSAKIDIGIGYKIIRFDILNQEEIIKVGTILMEETPPYIEKEPIINTISGESGEVIKLTTFGEKYIDIVMLEGNEEEVYVQDINSKLGYSMTYYYELFEYSGFEDHDNYVWNLTSGDSKMVMTVYDISNEEAFKDSLRKIEEEDLFESLSGEQTSNINKLYFRSFEEDEVQKVNYIYLIELDNLKLMVDLYYLREAEEGVGVYMHKMAKSIKKKI